MAFQTVFKRYEFKYILTLQQKKAILEAMTPYMTLDRYGRTTIRNIYYDTDNYLLARRSIEKPIYKEKLRVRSYEKATPESTVFVELKKKFEFVVFKRRISLSEADAMRWVSKEAFCPKKIQIASEIDYFLQYYKTLHPAMFISYEREAFFSKDGSDFRVTFDEAVLCRTEDISLTSEAYGTPILPQGAVLMEIKCSGGIPLWMVHALSEEHIYKASFSKYGVAYQTMIFPKFHKTVTEVLKNV